MTDIENPMVEACRAEVPPELLKRIHQVPTDEVLEQLSTSEQGLENAEVRARRKCYGINRLSEKKEMLIVLQFLLQFHNLFSYLLLAGAALSFLSEYLVPGEGSFYIAWALLGVTLLNAIFTFFQEQKAKKAMKAFRNLMTSQAVVLRGGERIQIESEHLVPGDIIVLAEGDRITADARLIEQSMLKVDHSALTGESEPQLRSLNATSGNVLRSRNMVFSGTLVQSGTGTAVVVATGDHTQIGKIARETSEVEQVESHLQRQIAHFIRIISYIAISLGISFFLLDYLIARNPIWIDLVFAIGIIVANVPEGLLPTVTLTLSLAAQRMARLNVLVKNIDAIETLGSLTVICSDKTGTLTENNLNVHAICMNDLCYDFDRSQGRLLLEQKHVHLRNIPGMQDFNDILVLCNNSTVSREKSFGDATELSLKSFVSAFSNISYIAENQPRLHEIPFSSESRFMVTVNSYNTNARAYLKGASEVVLEMCTHYFENGRCSELTDEVRKKLLEWDVSYAGQGFRVLGCAIKEVEDEHGDLEGGFCFYGLVVMQDPPRPEVAESVRLCKEAGIRVIVISGDQESTVEHIARQTGIIEGDSAVVVNGADLPELSDERLKELLQSPELLFARTLPRDKLRIVTLLKEMGEVVAVTGDGVNDAPALRRADVGIAMGRSGTEVAKEAADIVLLDDNFTSIVSAIKAGRAAYDNIKSFITYILTSNTPEIVPFLLFILLGWPLALPVLLILAIDLGTDMIPAIGLGVEKPESDIMQRPPRDPSARLLTWRMIARSYGFIGPLQTAFSYIIFFDILFAGGWSWGRELAVNDPLYMQAITGFFATIIITQMFNVFACRTTKLSAFSKGLFSNRLILAGIGSELLLLVVIALTPVGQTIFGTAAFDPGYLPLMLLFGAVILLCEELRKYLYRTRGIFGLE
ncbi:sodium/potassium-transporting ATPase subunit alpha [Mariprofundus ferrinatatus]|uniref:Sodium/potassium-transporting ATPase subunit alpha n=1 Tax=Mariprofundus ferrinatatus TaxID=1921087 RepID=A0A2K8L8U6_9PROT|nr:cation-transporting P-type ATPase [Mariprofundus ferrinatatus]ATX82311.1 sodium/potassium-transporting ATPase subunit alpha [Mariprofundus ferrinatatus]